MGGPKSDQIAACVLNAFDALPSKFKPLRNGDVTEWVPLSGIVLEMPSHGDSVDQADAINLVCISACTGMKSLPLSKLPQARGCVIHDSHAEILALRAFNAYLLEECARLLAGKTTQLMCLRRRELAERTPAEPQAFAILDGINIHMYCSDVPCGDASMEFVMASQTDATPWSADSKASTLADDQLLGRGHFDQLGVVRRKPARPDAPVCLSKSCTDKLTIRQCTSLLKGVTAKLIHPKNAYLHNLVLPASGYREDSCVRAFCEAGRLRGISKIAQSWLPPYAFHPFNVQPTVRRFDFSREMLGKKYKPCNKSAVWTPHFQEILVNGIVHGRKQGHPKAASRLSRRKLWEMSRCISDNLELCDHVSESLDINQSYRNFKDSGTAVNGRLPVKAAVIEILGNWPPNKGDDSFGLLELPEMKINR